MFAPSYTRLKNESVVNYIYQVTEIDLMPKEGFLFFSPPPAGPRLCGGILLT